MEISLDSNVGLLQSNEMPVQLDQAIEKLRRKMIPDTLGEAIGFLRDAFYHYTAMAVAEEMRPAKLKEYLAKESTPKTYSQLCRMINVVLFPLDDYSELQEEQDCDPRIIIPAALSPFGDFTWDSWEELLDNVVDYGPGESLAIFMRFLHVEVENKNWEEANNHFGWTQPSAPYLFNDKAEREFSYDQFMDNLCKAGFEIYLKAYQFTNFATENPLLDFSLGDYFEGYYSYSDYYQFNAETLRELSEAYETGSSWISAYEQARCQASPDILAQIARIYREAHLLKAETPQSLAEIFAGDGTEESKCQMETM